MSIAVFSPFGLLPEESGAMGLLANYLKRMAIDAYAVQCNGLFSLCDRDAESSFVREPSSCFLCMREQKALAAWVGMPLKELSVHLSPEDTLNTKRWMLGVTREALTSAKYLDYNVYDLCRGSLRERYGTDQPDLTQKNIEQQVRRMMVSAARMICVSTAFARSQPATMAFVADGDDFVSRSFATVMRNRGVKVALFKWDISARSVRVLHPVSGREFSCPFVFEDVTAMRADSRTWPFEIVKILDGLMVFLDISSSQLELPIAAG